MTSPEAVLRERIAGRSARVCVVGLGYVGMATAVAFAQAGFGVVGTDVDPRRCRRLEASGLRAFRSLADAGPIDVVDICVPTPVDADGDPDLSAIRAVAADLGRSVLRGRLVVLTSTTYPGTTEEIIGPVVGSQGLVPGEDVFVAFSPERIDPGNTRYDIRNTPRIVGGMSPACTALAADLYARVTTSVVAVSNARAAEMTKLLENVFRSVNIALANEMAVVCHGLGVDVWEVVAAASTKPFGFMPFFPGPGVGGDCIPVDPAYLAWKARQHGCATRFVELAAEVNRGMPGVVVERVRALLSGRGRGLDGSRILLLGVTYKPDVDDLRHSPAVHVLELLRAEGADVSYADPYVASLCLRDGRLLRACEPTRETLVAQDVVVVTTDHAAFDWDAIGEHAPCVFDTRGRRHAGTNPAWHNL